MSDDIANPLSESEKARLAELEGVIQENLFGFRQTMTALAEIREKCLHRGWGDFPTYIQRRWSGIWQEIGKRRIYQLVDAAEVVSDIAKTVDEQVDEKCTNGSLFPLPENERQARPLVALPREARGPVWKDLVQQNGGKVPPGTKVQNAVTAFFDGEAPPDVPGASSEPREPELLPAEESSRSRHAPRSLYTSDLTPSQKLNRCKVGIGHVLSWIPQAIEAGESSYRLCLDSIVDELAPLEQL